jgi:transposase
MLKVDAFAEIRRANRDGLSIRAIARQFQHTRRTVRKALAQPEPKPYRRSKPYPAPKLGPFFAVIDAMLVADDQAPRKQRHTAMQVFRRLQSEHGYTGGYDQVRRYIQRQGRLCRETFIPLSHDPGQRVEADFGHIYVDFPEGRKQVPVLIVTWSYSNCPFAIAMPSERTEAILHGLVEAFAFFGGVPREVWWDNPTTVATAILTGRERRVQPRYAALASHYTFEPLFCMPRRGNEKPRVENRVYDLQRRWATPVPQMADLTALNAHLRQCCLAERERTSAEQTETIGVRFERDRAAALTVPAHAFDPCVSQPAHVDKYQTVRFEHNQYSVPRNYAFQTVTVKAYVDRLAIVAAGQVVAQHARSYGRNEQILDPRHYLSTLARRPAALDHAPVYRHWQLPESFGQLRTDLEARLGPAAGRRHFVRVLQLVDKHPLERVAEAIAYCRTRGLLDAERIRSRTELLAADQASADANSTPSTLMQVHVPLPDLNRFNYLLEFGEEAHVPVPNPVAQVQLEAVTLAHDGSGV